LILKFKKIEPIPAIAHDLLKIPMVTLNDEKFEKFDSELASTSDLSISTISSQKKDNPFSSSNIFDLIHGVQINCECSPLDKENSHFVIADMAIAALELIKTQKQMNDDIVSRRYKYTTSPSIKISNKNSTIFENIESLDHFNNNSPVSNRINNNNNSITFNNALKPNRTHSLSTKMLEAPKPTQIRRIRSLNDLVNTPRNVDFKQTAKNNFSMFEASLDSTSFSTDFSSFSGSPLSPSGLKKDSKLPTQLLKFSSPTRKSDKLNK
jgi:hypothetical protein